MRIFPGGVAGLFPRSDLGPEGLCDGVACGSGVDGGRSASGSGVDVAGGRVGLAVFAGFAGEVNRLSACPKSGR